MRVGWGRGERKKKREGGGGGGGGRNKKVSWPSSFKTPWIPTNFMLRASCLLI